jgi:hypothetical protein
MKRFRQRSWKESWGDRTAGIDYRADGRDHFPRWRRPAACTFRDITDRNKRSDALRPVYDNWRSVCKHQAG